ncbi:MAG: Na+-transporting oxaloacetate decarboxylase subunit gamma [Epsilonproteobacteria bacterium]|nr:Na+-transporting oxaloacetate decarboxylase subunit gamma [Campylobacterota bacterium]
MENNLVVEAFKFMILGMTIVYLLLSLMVFLMGVQHKIVEKYFPDKPQDSSNTTPNAAASTQSSSSEDNAVVAAIVAAVSKYRKN